MPAQPAKSTSPKTSPAAKARALYHKVPTKTTADDPATYTKQPHDYGDVLIRPNAKGETRLGGVLQRDLVYWIERNTWGKNIGTPEKIVRPEWAKLSLSQLAKLCGSDRRTVARSLADLVERGIIEARDRSGCGDTVVKMYKLTPAKWKKAPYYEAKVMELEDGDATEDAEQDETPAPEATDEPESTVQPGKVSKPQAVAVSPSKGAPVIAIRVVYRSVDLPCPVAFRATPGRNGRVQISCRATAPQFFANPSPSVFPATDVNTQLSAYSAFLTPFVLKAWSKALDNSLLNQIVTAAEGAPIWMYERIVMGKFKNNREGHKTGLLIHLAGDAAKGWKLECEETARREAEEAHQRAQFRAEALAELETTPSQPEAAKCEKCSGTGKGKAKWMNRGGVYGPVETDCAKCGGTGRKAAA